jgi:hypothetical protein
LKSRLVPPWTGDPSAEGADAELDDRRRRPNVFHYGSCERQVLQAGIARQRERATNVRRRRSPDGRASLADLDGDGLPYFEGENGEVTIPGGGVAGIVIEAGRDIAGLVAERDEE